MDSIRRNRQIDSLKYLILKCQDGNSLSTGSSRDESSKLCIGSDNSVADSTSRYKTQLYDDDLLNSLTALSDTRSKLCKAILLSDTSLLTESEEELPGATLLSDLAADLDTLGRHVSLIGENMELLGWRLLDNKFFAGLDVPYENHDAIKSLLKHMAELVSDTSSIEMALQKAAFYKPSRKTNENLTKAGRALLDLRAKLEKIKVLRRNCSAGALAEANLTPTPGDDSTL